MGRVLDEPVHLCLPLDGVGQELTDGFESFHAAPLANNSVNLPRLGSSAGLKSVGTRQMYMQLSYTRVKYQEYPIKSEWSEMLE